MCDGSSVRQHPHVAYELIFMFQAKQIPRCSVRRTFLYTSNQREANDVLLSPGRHTLDQQLLKNASRRILRHIHHSQMIYSSWLTQPVR